MQIRGPAGFSQIRRGPFKIEQNKKAIINYIFYSQTAVVKSDEKSPKEALDDLTFSDFTTEEIEFPQAASKQTKRNKKTFETNIP